MKTTHQLFFIIIICFITLSVFSQKIIKGVVTDGDLNPLIGANVIIKGTTQGVSTDFYGKFSLKSNKDTGIIIVSYVGYEDKEISFNTTETDLGTVSLLRDNTLDEVVIFGVVDIAVERETPIAISTIRETEIKSRLGNLELPELLNATPSVYAIKSGGGFGDSRINIRGFTQVNTAVLINGVPINDMENGKVYWSNWAGLADIASTIQIQRGLGASRLAISSVGGTINIVTKTTQADEGGSVSTIMGNDSYLKTIASYSTGLMKNGFAFTALFSKVSGNGYINGTSFEGYNYFLGLGWTNNKDTQNLQLTLTGAPQVHGERSTSSYNAATITDYLKYGAKYNYNYGALSGQGFNWRRNFYHKPLISINWDWKISDNVKLTTTGYASFGRGGGTGDIGNLSDSNLASSQIFRDQNNGEVLFDNIMQYNRGQQVVFSDGQSYQRSDQENGLYINDSGDSGLTRRASINSHNWFGVLANLNTKINDHITFDVGVDMRIYKGYHYQRLDNLLGANAYRDNDNINMPDRILTKTYSSDFASILNIFSNIEDEEKIDYYNIGYVNWLGAFGQIEYKKESLSAFIQLSGSNQKFSREDSFLYTPAQGQLSEQVNKLGGAIKTGINYNLNARNNVFGNIGYYSKQPLFDGIFLNLENSVNEDVENEKIIGVELGYGYKSEKLQVNLNLYRTSWEERFLSVESKFDINNTPDNSDDDQEGRTNLNGIEQIHMGVELKGLYRPIDMLTVKGMFSAGNWEYANDVSGPAFNQDREVIGENKLYLKGVKVGNAAQITSRLAVIVEPINDLKVDISWFRADNLYASISAEDFNTPNHQGAVQLPSYNLFDGGISYNWFFGEEQRNSLNFRLNINNLFDETYLIESQTNIFAKQGDETYKGISTNNKAFFGFGRTWNFGVAFNF